MIRRRLGFRSSGYAVAIFVGALVQVACSSTKSAGPGSADGGAGQPGASEAADARRPDASQPPPGSTGAAGFPGNGGNAGSTGGGVGGVAGSTGGGASGSAGMSPAADAAVTDPGSGGQSSDRDAGAGIHAGDAAEDIASVGSGGSTGAAGWPAVTDYAAAGPFTPMRVTNTGPGGAYDVFRPTVLGAEGRRHPIISWANGTLYSVDDYQLLLSHWASHGFVVIAGHTNTTAGGATHKAGIDWLVAQNAAATSPYFGALDTGKIGASGHSQGGGATIAAGANKPGTTGITVTLPLMPLLSFEADQTIVSHQLVPMFNVNASMDNRDPTGTNANAIYAGAVTELVQATFIGVHEDAMNAKMHAPTVAWLRWKLMADVQAKSMFYPAAGCGLCQDADWKSVRYKNSPP